MVEPDYDSDSGLSACGFCQTCFRYFSECNCCAGPRVESSTLLAAELKAKSSSDANESATHSQVAAAEAHELGCLDVKKDVNDHDENGE